MNKEYVPEFAILGHPNEGKSSVVSTLAEDDSVRIGPVPGETLHCQTFPVKIDGVEIIRFVDTPGFQAPKQTLAWMKAYTGPDELLVENFLTAHKGDPVFRDECELLAPVARNAGIIYVVDGSRPVRNDDRAEMEILRMTARPRMSIINCKAGETSYLPQWKNEFRKHFNSIRQFNAHKATYKERLELLESLKSVDQDWEPVLSRVIEAFREDWDQRTRLASEMIVKMLEKILTLTLVGNIKAGRSLSDIQEILEKKYRKQVAAIETKAFKQLKTLFKHNIFNYDLPQDSLLNEEIFSEKTWQFLGLTPKGVALTAGAAGGAAGAVVDLAAAGLTFGIFSAIGGALGAGSALISGRRVSELKFRGVKLGSDQVKVSMADNVQFMYVLLDRAILFYANVINWAHGRRDYSEEMNRALTKTDKKGRTAYWDMEKKMICVKFFKSISGKRQFRNSDAHKKMIDFMVDVLSGCASS